MLRANHHFLPGYWHITRRCHGKSFLLRHTDPTTKFVQFPLCSLSGPEDSVR